MMINLNPLARLSLLQPVADSTASKASTATSTDLSLGLRSNSGVSVDATLEAKRKRVRQLKKQVQQLQQKLQRANARLASANSAVSGSATGRSLMLSAARAQVLAASNALSMVQTALFQAEAAASS
jgi:predicted  nucleic acid-binding Zn-ribbon protein